MSRTRAVIVSPSRVWVMELSSRLIVPEDDELGTAVIPHPVHARKRSEMIVDPRILN